jgi:hypothetical protein
MRAFEIETTPIELNPELEEPPLPSPAPPPVARITDPQMLRFSIAELEESSEAGPVPTPAPNEEPIASIVEFEI